MSPAQLPTRKIGNTDVTAIGYGAMNIAAAYGDVLSDEERFKLLDAVYELGCTNWDTADIYFDSEDLIGKWFKKTGKRDEIFIATKFGFNTEPGKPVIGNAEYVHKAAGKSLSRLGVDCIDLYYLHRADPEVPIEITVRAMAELVKQGKVKYLGISECSAATLRRAHAVHPIAAVEVEYSPFTLDIEDEKIGLLKTARELGVAIVAYAALGRGFLTGRYRSPDDLPPNDWRRTVPRYSAENFPNILKLCDGLAALGKKYNATAGQISLAWLLAQGDDIIPIPGTTKIANLKQNLAAVDIKLSPEDVEEVRKIAAAADATHGTRYPADVMHLIFADTPPLQE
ncbi:Aldo/keto reductase [Lentinus brumalis]|uniref:Aldo/keto reductase n=1 Tax=Lentinus brumalis TaxID=2498619 RepID=A0A371D0S9_9APHY|nr:Aldo/keto reductase [Polyporus brumalis]